MGARRQRAAQLWAQAGGGGGPALLRPPCAHTAAHPSPLLLPLLSPPSLPACSAQPGQVSAAGGAADQTLPRRRRRLSRWVAWVALDGGCSVCILAWCTRPPAVPMAYPHACLPCPPAGTPACCSSRPTRPSPAGEFQFAFLAFLLGQSMEGFAQVRPGPGSGLAGCRWAMGGATEAADGVRQLHRAPSRTRCQAFQGPSPPPLSPPPLSNPATPLPPCAAVEGIPMPDVWVRRCPAGGARPPVHRLPSSAARPAGSLAGPGAGGGSASPRGGRAGRGAGASGGAAAGARRSSAGSGDCCPPCITAA